jgi:hypothetical protein
MIGIPLPLSRLFPTLTMARNIKIFCWILDECDRSFSISIDDDQTVDDLKREIVKERPTTLGIIGLDKLTLCKVCALQLQTTIPTL